MEWLPLGIEVMASKNERGFCFQDMCGGFCRGNIFPLPQGLQLGGLENSRTFKKLMQTAFSKGQSLELFKKGTSNVVSYLKSTLKMSSGFF